MIKRIISFTLAVVLLLLFFAALMLTSFLIGYEIHRDVRYGGSEYNVMDVYIPKEAYSRRVNGCVLFIHGGSWSGGDKSEEEIRCRNVANRGYIAVNVNYTLYNDENKDWYTVDLVLEEIDSALKSAQDFCKNLGIELTMAATSGYSAGAHLSMLYSYSRGAQAPLEIKFTANMAGPADIGFDAWDKDTALAIARILSGEDVSEDDIGSGRAEEIFSKISPVHYVSESSPPSLFIYGGKDTVVDPKNAEVLVNKFDTVGAHYDYYYLPDSTHSLSRNFYLRLAYSDRLIEYCHEYFK